MLMAAILGALTASHLCCVAERLAVHRSQQGRSVCNACAQPLGWRDVVPIWSWFAARGRARCCSAPVPGRYPAWEAYGALGAASAVTLAGDGPAGWALAGALVALVFTRTYRSAVTAATGTGPCAGHHGPGSHQDPGVYRFAGALRCGWCGTRVDQPTPALP